MGEPRLASSVEVAALLRRAQIEGDFGTVLHKGDPERGSILIVVRKRGHYVAVLERSLSLDGRYAWATVGPAEGESEPNLASFLVKRTEFDQDLWLIELDVAHPERFIAETTLPG